MLHCKFSGDYNSERIFLNRPIFDEVMCRAFGVHFFSPHCIIKMQACNVTLPTPVIFSRIFGVIIPDSHLPKCNKTRIKWHKIAHKTSKHRLRLGLHPRPRWVAYATLPGPSSRLGNWIKFYHYRPISLSLHVQCPFAEKKQFSVSPL